MNLYFLIPTYTEGDSTFPKPVCGDYKYWFSLISAFLKKSDTIEIHCWNEEINTVEEIVSLKQGFKKINEENLTIFKGKVTTTITKFLLNNHCNKQGELEWFTLNLYKNNLPVVHSGHWGTEFIIFNATEEDIVTISKLTPRETIFHQF